jgi:hypothetical protein
MVARALMALAVGYVEAESRLFRTPVVFASAP